MDTFAREERKFTSLMGSFLNGEYKNPKFPSEPQIKTLLELLKEAEEDDFIYLN